MSESSLDKARVEINQIDKEMAELFIRRMRAVEAVAEYKKKNGLAVLDTEREKEVIKRNSALVDDEVLRGYYVKYLNANMSLSRAYQEALINGGGTMYLDLGANSYKIHIGRGLLSSADRLFNLDRRVFIVTDSGVPSEYSERVRSLCKDAKIAVIEQGEDSKSPEILSRLLTEMLDFGMTRTDCVVAVGGGVVGDLSGFAAATYMRGIDFYNIPTTLLAQVDSSVGGKTAINLGGVKNIVGAFYQPRAVIIDPDTLKTLPKRQISNGLAEAIKMALTCDSNLFSLIEENEIDDSLIDEIIKGAIIIKRSVVERDEREAGLRKILNFGHTLAHAIEAEEEMHGLYHGECVAIGMLACSSDGVRERLIPLLNRLELPTEYKGDMSKAISFIAHDKKCEGDRLSVILVDEPGEYRIEKMSVEEFGERVRRIMEK